MKGLAKLVCLALLLLSIVPNTFSQPKIWGTLQTNGITESGSVFQIELDGSDYTSIKDFVFPNCSNPRGNVLYASNGKVYGNADGGFGSFNTIIYEYDPDDSSFEFVHSFFDPTTGMGESAMLCNLIEHSNGKVYGMTQQGGDYYDGTLFEFDLQTKEINVKIHFESATKGSFPLGGLTEASDGRMYGVTLQGGTHDLGVLYVYDPATNIFAVLKHFDGVGIGANPHNSPIQAANGKLIGTTRIGGTADLGTVYEYDIASNIVTKKHDFDGAATGSFPYDKFCLATNGIYYAMTSAGGINDMGALVEFDQVSGVLTKKLDFNGTYGRYPTGALVQFSDGYLYGKTTYGGLENDGVLFKYDPNTSTFTKLLDFYEEFGESAYDGLTITPEGKLMGVTWKGGLAQNGVLFEFTPSTGIYQQLIHFRYSDIGGLPQCSLIEASDGLVYGTTTSGGVNSWGIIFRIDPADRSFEKIFDFEAYNLGGVCKDGVIEASNGMLYGLASVGGANMGGVLFALDPSAMQYTVLVNFDENVSGGYPLGKLIQGSNGNLYGVTQRGGVNGDGVLFEYNMNTSSYVLLHEFNVTVSGRYPSGPMQASNGKLYGTTHWGGAYDKGVLYEYDLLTNSMSTKVDFDNLNKGAYPVGVPVEHQENQLYALTGQGGSDGGGVLYHFNASNGLFTKIKNLMDDGYGFSPTSSLMKASNDLIYGTTANGGPQDYGVVFSFDPLGGDFTVAHAFGKFSDRPVYSTLFELDTDFGINEPSENKLQFTIFPNPAKEYFTISSPDIEGEFQITIYNVNGKLIFNEKRTNDVNCDILDLESGIYTVRISSANRTGIQKLIVN